eukprot:gene13140-27791_t
MGSVIILNQKKDMTIWDGSVCEGVELEIEGKIVLGDAYVGCSIAVNGVCLTVTSFNNDQFTVGLAPETLRRSNLGLLAPGDAVNLERALRADGRNSGHFVQGHVDCTGKIIQKWRENESLWMKIQVPKEYMKFIVAKGFIAIDGTSLTICEVDNTENWFTYMLISHTQQSVIQAKKDINELVNVEVDVLSKMVDQSLSGLSSRVEKIEQQIEQMNNNIDISND